MAPPDSLINRPACVLLADHERSWLFLDRVNSRPVRRSNRAIAESVNVVSSSSICAANEAIRRRLPKSLSRLTGATAPSRANLANLAGWMLSPRWRGRAMARTKVSRSSRASMLSALVEWGDVRSHVNRDRPMVGSCLSRSSRAFFGSSSSVSLSACADNLRARARPAKPIRSNVPAFGNTSRCAFISPAKRASTNKPCDDPEVAQGAEPAQPPERAAALRRSIDWHFKRRGRRETTLATTVQATVEMLAEHGDAVDDRGGGDTQLGRSAGSRDMGGDSRARGVQRRGRTILLIHRTN